MTTIKKLTLTQAFKPFDIVSDEHGNVGYIQETHLNDSQDNPIHQVSYSVQWLVIVKNDPYGGLKHAWYQKDELKYHCNLFVKIAAASSCTSVNEDEVIKLFNHFGKR